MGKSNQTLPRKIQAFAASLRGDSSTMGLFSSRGWADILWWYATLFIASLAFKILCLDYAYVGGATAALGVSSDSFADTAGAALRLGGRDVFEVAIVTLSCFFISRFVPLLKFHWLMFFGALLWLALGSANLFSFRELRSPLTLDSMLISIGWVRAEPTVLVTFFNKKQLLLAAILVAWCAIPLLLAHTSTAGTGHRSNSSYFGRLALRGTISFVLLGTAASIVPEFALRWWWVFGALFVSAVFLPGLLSHTWRSPVNTAAIKRSILGVTTAVIAGSSLLAVAKSPETSATLFGEGYMTGIARSVLDTGARGYEDLAAPPLDDLRDRYNSLAYPTGDPRNSKEGGLVSLDEESVTARHIIIISLETAFEEHYELTDDKQLPTFYRLSQQAIVSQHHYTPLPFTIFSGASMMTGLYASPRDGNPRFRPDSLPNVLARFGYVSTYIDAFVLDWMKPDLKPFGSLYNAIGFDKQLDAESIPGFEAHDMSFETRVRMEEAAIGRIVDAVRSAEMSGKRALVFEQSALGHFPWNSRPEDEDDSAAEKLYGVAQEMDRIVGLLMKALDDDGLTEQSIVVITGDHGPRLSAEFESLGRKLAHSDLTFNVPLIISAPGLLDHQVRVPFVTSHIDLAPTLLDMVGVPRDNLFYHGASIVSEDISERVTFLMNTRLTPVDGYYWNGYYFTHDKISGASTIASNPSRSDLRSIVPNDASNLPVPEHLMHPDDVLSEMTEVCDLSIAYFLR